MRRFIQKNTHVVNVPYRFNDELARAHTEKREVESRLGHGIMEDDHHLSARAQRTFSRTAQRVNIDGATDPETGEPGPMDLMDPSCEEPLLGDEEKQLIHRLINELPSRLQMILRARFGLDGSANDPDTIPTLEMLAGQMGITRERVRQLEMAALSKLRQRLRKLKNFEHLQLTPR